MSKIASLTRSEVGRRLKPFNVKSFFPLHLPLMTRKRLVFPLDNIWVKMILTWQPGVSRFKGHSVLAK
jgi:hypothetical protein